ncbi:DUF4364 family protein [Eubacterium aggregans]|uniref:DUF4364 family protein n=1 Tax=Eubacterium aggregans TaxID=81409 RepID=UPI003F3FDD85
MLNPFHQTEDKLIILYVLNKIKTGITREQLAYIIIQNVQISYFDIQLYIDALLGEQLIQKTEDGDEKEILTNTADGNKTMELLLDKIPMYLQEMLDRYILESRNKILNEVYTTADYKKNGPYDFQVSLSLSENGIALMSISVNTPTKEEAVAMCEKWKGNTQKIYAALLKDLT